MLLKPGRKGVFLQQRLENDSRKQNAACMQKKLYYAFFPMQFKSSNASFKR